MTIITEEFDKFIKENAFQLHETFGGGFHLLDEGGIRRTCRDLKDPFGGRFGFINHYAVKANTDYDHDDTGNDGTLEIVASEGFGFDCSSIPELNKAVKVLLKFPAHKTNYNPDRKNNARIMFTSNNTSDDEFLHALHINNEIMPVIINVDDESVVRRLAKLNGGTLPETICFRYNPGDRRSSGSTTANFGNPKGQKYGIAHEKFIDVYRTAIELGAKNFGIHTMIASNCLEIEYIQETISMLLEIVVKAKEELGIEMQFINMGGGIGIPYSPKAPRQERFNIEDLGSWVIETFETFERVHGFCPDMNMECGRYIAGPSGVLIGKVINKCYKHGVVVGLDINTCSNPRPQKYGAEITGNEEEGWNINGYHHIEVISQNGETDETEVVSVVDSLCENDGRFATDRELTKMEIGDIVVIYCTGAHALEMWSLYNSRFPCQHLMRYLNNSVKQIRREMRESDLDATLTDLDNTVYATDGDQNRCISSVPVGT